MKVWPVGGSYSSMTWYAVSAYCSVQNVKRVADQLEGYEHGLKPCQVVLQCKAGHLLANCEDSWVDIVIGF